jgi:putative DNA-invertase from lambdoid prophage Rac
VVLRVGLYARVSTEEQQTLPLQLKDLRAYAKRRGWKVALEVEEVGSGAKTRPKREALLAAARRREVDVVVVWRLDRWGRSLADLVVTLQELADLGVGFASVTEALDFTTAAGRALAGMLAVFAAFERDILRERVKAGMAQARAQGKHVGRPPTPAILAAEILRLAQEGLSKGEIARRTKTPRTTVRRVLAQPDASKGRQPARPRRRRRA